VEISRPRRRAINYLKNIYSAKFSAWLFRQWINHRQESTLRVDSLVARVNPDAYRQNLTRLAELCRVQGSTCIFMVLHDNPVHDEYAEQGQALLAEGKINEAIEYLTIAANKKANWSSVLARRQLIKAYESAGKQVEADALRTLDRSSTVTMSIMGGTPIHDDHLYNDIMRDVARTERIRVVEAGQVLDENPSDYGDMCHPDEQGHRRIAELLREPIQDALADHMTNRHAP
jgi:hypothetical protein